MRLHIFRCFHKHLRMLLQSLRALSFDPARPGSIWMYLEALVRSTGVIGRLACGFWTNLHFADVGNNPMQLITVYLTEPPQNQLPLR